MTTHQKDLDDFLANLGQSQYDEERLKKTKFLFNKMIVQEDTSLDIFFGLSHGLENALYIPSNQDFNKKYDFIFSGCSQTHAKFICPPHFKDGDHNNIWGFQIANHYGKEGLNLAMEGWSAQSILKRLMKYFSQHGHPKVLLVLYPDLGRMPFVSNNKIAFHNKTKTNYDTVRHLYLHIGDDYNFSKISKVPHKATDVIPWKQALYEGIQSILILDQYCKANNIYFKYSSWHFETNMLLKILKDHRKEYQNFCEPEFLNIQNIDFEFETKCHLQLINKTSENVWSIAIDKEHLGVHKHIHIAEMFRRVIDCDNPWN